MDLILVRHGESEGNAVRRLQGRIDSPLSERGCDQARRLAAWLTAQGISWDAAYSSTLERAAETGRIVCAERGLPAPLLQPDLREIAAGDLEGMTRQEMEERFPAFLDREITDLGDFAEFGGESYEDVQRRVRRVLSDLEQRHRDPPQTVLLVAHGGINFQLVKAVTCIPVPRVNIIRWGNCTATFLQFRERRGLYMAEVLWHVPVELMGGGSSEGSSTVFR
jgi:broad specificity phosphatase PhoE